MIPSIPTAAKVDKITNQVNIMIPNWSNTVKKSAFLAVFRGFGIYVDQTLYLIDHYTAFVEEMRGDDIGSVADPSFCLDCLYRIFFHTVTPLFNDFKRS